MYIDAQGKKWFKGNLHMHTTGSDGKMAPDEAAALYRANGYDFIARTEHWKVSPDDEYTGILSISGCEYHTGTTVKEGIYHIVALGMEKDPAIPREEAASAVTSPEVRKAAGAIVDAIHACGGLAVLGHPAWSLNTPEQILAVHREHPFDMTEIFNSTSDLPRNCRPYSGLITDMLAASGTCLRLSAVDDTHWYCWDECRSFVWVQAEAYTRDAILEGLRAGRFYGSQGPTLDVQYTDGKVLVSCSPAEEIVYYTDSVWVNHRSDAGEALTHGEYTPGPNDSFVRVEVRDPAGRYAWSQYVRMQNAK